MLNIDENKYAEDLDKLANFFGVTRKKLIDEIQKMSLDEECRGDYGGWVEIGLNVISEEEYNNTKSHDSESIDFGIFMDKVSDLGYEGIDTIDGNAYYPDPEYIFSDSCGNPWRGDEVEPMKYISFDAKKFFEELNNWVLFQEENDKSCIIFQDKEIWVKNSDLREFTEQMMKKDTLTAEDIKDWYDKVEKEIGKPFNLTEFLNKLEFDYDYCFYKCYDGGERQSFGAELYVSEQEQKAIYKELMHIDIEDHRLNENYLHLDITKTKDGLYSYSLSTYGDMEKTIMLLVTDENIIKCLNGTYDEIKSRFEQKMKSDEDLKKFVFEDFDSMNIVDGIVGDYEFSSVCKEAYDMDR